MSKYPEFPPYRIRGIPLYGFSSIARFADFLIPAQHPRYGMLVAINAEKVLSAEKDPQLRQILSEAAFNYADGISIVRSVRKISRQHNQPDSRSGSLAGADAKSR